MLQGYDDGIPGMADVGKVSHPNAAQTVIDTRPEKLSAANTAF